MTVFDRLKYTVLLARMGLLWKFSKGDKMDAILAILTMGLPYIIKDPATLAKVLAFISQIKDAVGNFEAGHPATFTFGPEHFTALGQNVSASETLTLTKAP